MFGMKVYLLKRDSIVYQIEEQDSLERLVRLSLILPSDRLKRDGESRYRAAKSFPELKSLFAMDAWDTWDELGDEDPDEVWSDLVVVLSEPVDSPVEEVQGDHEAKQEAKVKTSDLGVEVEATNEPEVPALAKPIVFPIKKDENVAVDIAVQPENVAWKPPPIVGGGNVVPLVKPLVTKVSGDYAGAPQIPDDIFIRQALSTTSKKPPRRFSSVFVVLAVTGLFVLILFQYSIRNTAQWSSVASTRISRIDRGDDLHNNGGDLAYGIGEVAAEGGPDDELVLDTAGEAEPPEPSVAQPDDTEILIRNLRSMISGPPREMDGEDDDLTTALMLDLSRLRGRVDRIRAPVTLWGGGSGNVPLEASIDIWLHSSGDLLTDVAVVSLAVGRIVQYYDTVVAGLSLTLVTEDGPPRRIELSGSRTADFYQNRITFSEFIEFL